MAFIVKESGGGDFEPHPAGVFASRCIRVVDLGTQDEVFEGKPKKQRKVLFFFETSELMTDGELAGKPFIMNREFSVSLGEKATLRKCLESWRGRKFTPAELDGFDITTVIGKPLMLNIIEYTKQNKKPGVKIDSLMPLPAGMPANKAVSEMFYFSLYDDSGENVKPLDEGSFKKLGKYWQGKIQASPEYKVAIGGIAAEQRADDMADTDEEMPF